MGASVRIEACRAAEGCVRSVGSVAAAVERLSLTLRETDADSLASHMSPGPVREHSRLRLTIAGCPNACSRPQIVDFGLIAARRPVASARICSGCGACVEACDEGAIEISPSGNGWTMRVSNGCVACGACTAACPEGALAPTDGWRVLVGGRLGRHPALAREVSSLATLDEAEDILRQVLEVWAVEGRPGERLGAVFDRIGWRPALGQPTPADLYEGASAVLPDGGS